MRPACLCLRRWLKIALDLFTLEGRVTVQTRDAETGLRRVDGRARDAQGKFVALDKDTKKLSGDFDHAGRSSQKFAGNLSTVTRQARESHSAVGILSKGLGGLSSIASGAMSVATGGALTSLLGSAADMVSSQIGKGVQFIKTMERGRVALTAITRDGAATGRTLAQLGEYADDAGLDLDDTVTGAQRLLGFGYALDTLIPKMRDMGDLTASTGDPSKFENIVTALGQMRGATNAQAEEFNQLRDAGVNALGLLSEATGKTTSELRQMITAQQVSGRGAADLILEASRRRYGGLAQQLANDTLEGREKRLSNLGARRTGEAIQPAVGRYSDAVMGAADILGSEQGERFSKSIAGAADLFLSRIETGIKALATGNLSALGRQAVDGAAAGARAGASALYDAGANVAGQLEQGWRDRLDQHSPSKVLTDLGFQAGQSLVFGFVQGIQDRPISERIEQAIKAATEKFKLPPNLLKELIYQESRFKPGARSPKGAMGLTQLMPGTAADMGVNKPYDIEQNVMGGARYLRQLLDQFNGDVRLALAAYNAGPGAVQKYGNRVPPYRETQNYVATITQRLDALTLALGTGGATSGGPVPVTVSNLPTLSDFFSQFAGKGYTPPLALGHTVPDRPASGDLRGGVGTFPDAFNPRGFAERLYDMQKSTAASDRTSVAEQADWQHTVSMLADEMQVSRAVSLKIQGMVAQRLEDERRALSVLSAQGEGFASGDLPAFQKLPFDVNDYLRPAAAVSTLNNGLKSAVESQFALSRALSQTGDAGADAARGVGAFTAEQQRANLALLMGGQAAGKAKEQFAEYVDGLADGITDALGRGFEGGWQGAREGFRDLLLDMTRDALRSELREALRSLFNVKSEEADGGKGGGNFNPINALLGKVFNRGASGAKDNTPSAVRDAGVQAVSAVKGAGEAQAGAITTTGDATTRGLSGVSQTLLTGLAAVANQIAIGQQGTGFWKGLFTAAAVGGINGALGSVFSGAGRGPSPGAAGIGGPVIAPPVFGSPGLGGATPGTLGFASGGLINGPGTSTSDSIAAFLSNGEFVMTAAAVRGIGVSALQYMNAAGRMPQRFASGGYAGNVPAVAPMRVETRDSGRPGSNERGAPVYVSVSVRPDAHGRVRSRSQIEVEVYQSSTDSARRNS